MPAHDGRAGDKRDVVSAIDAAFFGEVLPMLTSDTVVAVTADHATSCVRKAHTADPVPLLASGGRVTPDGTASFGERSCADGSLGQMLGPQILPRLSALLRGGSGRKRPRLRIPASFRRREPKPGRAKVWNRIAELDEPAYHARR
ncbi:hypothetical protein BH18ACT17_BH18ACT17_03930 [soil metagenome]